MLYLQNLFTGIKKKIRVKPHTFFMSSKFYDRLFKQLILNLVVVIEKNYL